jgi:hypothetical protein
MLDTARELAIDDDEYGHTMIQVPGLREIQGNFFQLWKCAAQVYIATVFYSSG